MMDFGLQEALLAASVLAVLVVLTHGFLAMRRNNELRIQLDKNYVGTEEDDPEVSDLMLLRAELPNGGARVVRPRDEDEANPDPSESVAAVAQTAAPPEQPDPIVAGEDIPVFVESVAMPEARVPADIDDADSDGIIGTVGVRSDTPSMSRDPLPDIERMRAAPAVESAREEAALEGAALAGATADRADGDVSRADDSNLAGVAVADVSQNAAPDPAPLDPAEASEPTPVADEAAGRAPGAEREPQPVVLSVLADRGMFSGAKLRRVLESLDMAHGEMDIFHRLNPQGEPEFSLANAVKPGTFSPDTMDGMETPGVTLFMIADQLVDPGSTYENMLMVAQILADELGGTVKDEQRDDLTDQTIDSRRDSLRGYRLRA